MSQAIDLRQALDPEYSCVVTACAGSGKTWLLTARILRALLAGAHPDEILAITFTRKAIGEIEERIRARLEAFAEADDDELARLLDEIGAPADKATRLRARRIQREFLLSEKGMSVYTFHSWFLRLLRSAPWLPEPGAAIPRKITEADRLHLKEAWRLLLDSADPDSPVGRNLLDLVAMTDQQLDTVKELLTRFVDRRELWLRFGMGCGKESDPLEKAGEALGKFLQAGPDDDPARSLFGSEEFWERIDRIRAHVGALAKPKAKSKVDRFLDGRLAPQQRGDCAQCLEALEKALLTKEGAPLKILLKGPDLEPVVDDVKAAQKRLADMLDHERRIAVLRFNRLALSVADAWLRQYNAVKEAHDENDFTYVEIAACTLLSGDGGSGGNADAIRYKMGQTYRHILVDEFQDTNALQWEALRAWLDSALDSGAVPKVFIVGDPKQSVYRFRGGNPALLGEAGSYLKDKYGAPRPFSQNVTRRCAPRLLDVVNGTFIRTLEGFKKHEAFKDNARLPGRVELAAVSAPKDSPKADGQDKTPLPLRNPLTTPPSSGDGNGTDKAEAEAQMLAERLRAAKEEWAVALPGEKVRPCEWGDFMVLFVQRTNLHALERALRTADIPCVSDSGSGLQSLECGDILALMQVLANPTSNLHLLQVLRSPLFGVASEDLAVVADRGAGGAWRKLQRAAELSPRMRRARDLLREWRGLYRSQPMPAHDFMSEICRRAEVFERYELAVPKGIRHRVRTNLRMLLHLSLREGMARHPHLPRLLREYRRTAAADGGGIREDPPLGNEVALLTIHKAKGLERPFVFVYNAHRSFKRSKGSVQSWILTDVPRDGGAPLPAFCPSKAQGRPKALDALAEEEEEKERAEWHNKLYVALTRAQQGIVVSGGGAPETDSWYSMVEKAVHEVAGKTATTHGDDLAIMHAEECKSTDDEEKPRPASPSGEAEPPAADEADIVLQQWKPHRIQTPEQQRGELLHAILALRIGGIDDRGIAMRAAPMLRRQFDELWEASGQMLAGPAVRRMLGPENLGSKACEIALAGPEGIRRIDCIVEFGEALWILDFKTGDIGPNMKKYRAQLDDYGALLRAACPGREIRCALVSERGELIESADA